MTTPHRTLQMALDALDAITDDVDGTGLNTMPSFDKAIDAISALREALAADHLRDVAEKVAPAAPVPDGIVMVPMEPTPEMIAAYLAANTQYWAAVDALPGTPVTKWRQGTPSDATRESYRAMIAASPAAPAAPVVRELQDDLIESVIRDVAELDYSSLPDMPEVMLVTANELRGILQAHGITGGKP